MGADVPTVLVIGGGGEAMPVLHALTRRGARLVVVDDRPDAPGFTVAAAGLLAATLDVESMVEAVRTCANRVPIDGVLCTARPMAVTAAAVAAALGRPGLPPQVAVTLADRLLVQQRLGDAGIPVPLTRALEGPKALATVMAAEGCPMAVKPADAWGARGVVRVGPGDDLGWAYRVAAAASSPGRVLAQRFVAGRALSAVVLVVGEEPVVLDVSERSDEAHARFAPFLIDAGHQGPSAIAGAGRRRLERLLAAVVRVLGVRDNLLVVELRADADELTVVDLHVGLTRGRRLACEIPLATGIDVVGAALDVALGDRPSRAVLAARWHRAVAERGCFPCPGTVVGVERVDETRSLDGVELVDVAVSPGSRVGARTSNHCRGGTIVATGPTPAAAAARAVAAAAALRIVTDEVAGRFAFGAH